MPAEWRFALLLHTQINEAFRSDTTLFAHFISERPATDCTSALRGSISAEHLNTLRLVNGGIEFGLVNAL